MAKTSGLSSSPPPAAKAAAAAPAANKAKSKPAPPPSKGEVKGKGNKADAAVDSGKLSPLPPSTDTQLDKSRTDSLNDSFSYSKEGYSSRNVTTESSTRLVDNLVNAYTGEHSGIENSDYGSSDRGRSYSRGSSECNNGCGGSGSYLKERFQKLDDAGRQLGVAREKVERILDKAVEARISDSKPVSETDEKRAIAEEERITKAEGSLHRTREKLSEKKEFRRQRQLDYCAKRDAAESALLAKYGNTSPQLRDHLMKTFKPVIAKDSEARNDINHLQEEAERHLRTDSEAVRLARETCKEPDEEREARAGREKIGCRIEDKVENPALLTAEEKAKHKAEKQKVREEHKKREVECRRERTEFKEQARGVAESGRTHQLESEIKKAEKNAPARVHRELSSLLSDRIDQTEGTVRQALDRVDSIKAKHQKPDAGVDERLHQQEKQDIEKAEERLKRTRVELDDKKELQRRHKDVQQERKRADEEKHKAQVERVKRGDTIAEKKEDLASPDKKLRRETEIQSATLQRKKQDVECRLERGQFKEDVRNASQTDRALLVERELERLDKNTPAGVRQQLETRLNEQLSNVQVEETRTAYKEDDGRRKAVDTLVDTRAKRSGKVGQELNPISKAIDDLDSAAIRKTHQTLEDTDINSITSVVDLERKFGRGISEVRTDLEAQISRGGKSVTKARKTLGRIDKLAHRSQLMREGDGWDALMSCITPNGPNLGRFLGLNDGSWGGRPQSRGSSLPFQKSGVDTVAAQRIARRLAQSGSQVDDERKARVVALLGNAG